MYLYIYKIKLVRDLFNLNVVAIYLKFKTSIKIYLKFVTGDLFLISIYLKYKIIQNISGDLSFKKCLHIEVNSK